MDEQLKQSALDFHEFPVPGKIQVLGLGTIGALAGKPVMEGKGVLFKKFAGIDVFDIEVDELDPDKFINVVAALEPTFGGINLEDIKAPECFYIEQKLRERMNIPVFHDDQHGTAIISTAAILNGLRVVEKNISDVRMVVSGAGAAAIACMNLLVALGMQKHNIVVCDSKGVIYKGREPNMAETKAAYAVEDSGKRTLDDVIDGADIFLGCSGPKVLTQEMVKKMARAPMILALANPEPEILPPLAKEVRSDAIICTGRSDYPNQVNNVLCFPFIFRGALDVGATAINEEMKLAAVHAIAELAHAEQSEVVASAYGDQDLSFGAEYIIPKPFDPRLIVKIAPAVAKAAMDSGVATRPIADFDAYIEMRIQKLGLQIKAGVDFEIVNNESDPRFKEYWNEYYNLMKRRGITQEQAQRAVISNTTVIGAIMVQRGEADALICGTIGDYHEHYSVIQPLFGYREGVHAAGAMNALLLPSGNTFIADTYVNHDPSPEQIAEITLMAAETVRRFGIEPRVALLSHSNFLVMPNMEAARISYNLLRVSSSEGVTVGPVLMGVAKPVHILTPIASVRRIVNMVALAVVEAQTQPL